MERSKADQEFLATRVRDFVKADISEKLRTGEIVIVRTEPDGTRIYRKAAKVQ